MTTDAHVTLDLAVLRALIADVCALQSFATCPREDSYCALVSDERRHAQDDFDGAYGMCVEDGEP
jgi:hypothetical protein